MDLVNPRDMLVEARRGGYAIGAFNIHNLETLQAVAEAAAEAAAPVILQATPGTVKYAGADYLVAMARVAAGRAGVPVALHLDHATDIDLIGACLEAGFTSVMFDGSTLPLEENIARTRQVAAMAHAKGAAVEAELGRLGGREDDLSVDEVEANYTDPEEAVLFVGATGIDSLAVAIGTAHGVYRGEPRLDFDRLKTIAARMSLPLVLHGASGLPDAAVTNCIALGICKVNIATELKLALAASLRETLAVLSEETDPRHYFAPARRAVKDVALGKMRLCGAAGRVPPG
ncbi:Ketose-bisphosphate aldolase, class-II [Moorella glycerini]|uniref:D-tagatose-1,6-bisphosphate aldolase subunit GatY n=1 Tax=Neomoorella stamsii TaxID=1266720 RepID=A0A9X7P7H1_9FIRM|nr:MULTISPECIES: tagatose-bisphosphate aldolase subunit GatY [Moorella]PRR77459.1 D-tagatose-1,6-bisphosphate aldolase subunit GatY [Moorella stamsii]CEP68208.1 Ketose-bisphosphate aldolase, class-II [Moorella glycerini]